MARGRKAVEGGRAQKTPRERFLEVAAMRTNKVLRALDALGKCSGRGYESRTEEIDQICDAINARCIDVHKRLSSVENGSKDRFAFES